MATKIEVIVNGSLCEITKEHLLVLVEQGKVRPETLLVINGVTTRAEKVSGVFPTSPSPLVSPQVVPPPILSSSGRLPQSIPSLPQQIVPPQSSPNWDFPSMDFPSVNTGSFCPTCGNLVDTAAQTCSRCGSPIFSSQQTGYHPQQMGYVPAAQHYNQYAASSGGIGYFDVLKKYVQFSGRARRKEFWMFHLINMIIIPISVIFLAVFIGGIIGGVGQGSEESLETASKVGFVLGVLLDIYMLVILLPSLAVFVRRLHDSGHSGWWFWIGVVPLVGWVIHLVFLVEDSQRGSNKYGAYPK